MHSIPFLCFCRAIRPYAGRPRRSSRKAVNVEPATVCRLVGVDLALATQRSRDVVEPMNERLLRVPVEAERDREAAGMADLEKLQVDRELVALVEPLAQLRHLCRRELHRSESRVDRVRAEDVAERRCDHDAEAVVLERPRRMLTRRAAAEVRADEQDGCAGIAVELEARVLHPVEEEELAVAGSLDALQELLGDYLVGVDVAPVEYRDAPRDVRQRPHTRSRTSVKWPATAAAAAIAGLSRCVRPPAPWRPSKFRFDVEAQRSPGARTSGFIPRHIEQPARRHSKPADSNTSRRPSSSACCFTRAEPGTTIACTPAATRRPAPTSAAVRRSSMRAFVQEPMNTRSIRTSTSGVPGARSMYRSARSTASRCSSAKSPGSGTTPSIGTTMPGFVPQVTCGFSCETSTTTVSSKVAPSSVRRSANCSKDAGAHGRPSRYANVVSSGAIIPARAPASLVMLQIVILPSMETARTGPRGWC